VWQAQQSAAFSVLDWLAADVVARSLPQRDVEPCNATTEKLKENWLRFAKFPGVTISGGSLPAVLLSFERAQTAVAKSRGASLVSVKLYQFRQGPSHRLGQTIRFR
jgi:hypothetical protein